MKRAHLVASLAIFGAAAGACLVVACSDGATYDFSPTDDASPDATAANVPEAAPPVAPTDAADARGPFDPEDEKVTCPSPGSPCAAALAAGDLHVCAQLDDGTVRCWGEDAFGALGTSDGDGAEGGRPAVQGLTHVTQISAAGATTCARTDDGKVFCWGENTRGQLGRDTDPRADEDRHPDPMQVPLPAAATRVDVGYGSACAVLADNTTFCWGDDQYGQLAREVPGDVEAPGPASLGPSPKVKTAIGTATGFALTTTGDLSSYGALAGDEGVLAGRVSSISPDPTPAIILSGVSTFAVSRSIPGTLPEGVPPWTPLPPPSAHACAVVGGAVHCWGRNARGALCTGLPDPVARTPRSAPIASLAYAQRVAVGGDTTCARLTNGEVHCCGTDDRGQLGKGATGAFSTFFARASAYQGHAVDVVTTQSSVCALDKDGTVACWGGNTNGELGQAEPDANAHATPVKVAF